MGFYYVILFISFAILFIINVVWVGINIYFWATEGLQSLLLGMNFAERIAASILLKWIILADVIWLILGGVFLFSRKHYKTDPKLHYHKFQPIDEPRICVIIPAYNEEQSIKNVVLDYKNQKNVTKVIVVDNHSTDKTVELAEKYGAFVIKKEENKGFTDSCIVGYKNALKTDVNIIALTEADQTFSGHDLEKFAPYLDNCDLVIGTRQVQVLSEKDTQNSMFYVWGNYLLAKSLQLKYFSLLHMGVVELTDVGCVYRCIKREALEKIMQEISNLLKDKKNTKADFSPFAPLMTMISIENDLRIVEVPITFKKRVGVSKSQVAKKSKGIRYGLYYLWLIISR